nr:MAG TPA: hypothetical protein [Caudoviricetes sp.]
MKNPGGEKSLPGNARGRQKMPDWRVWGDA